MTDTETPAAPSVTEAFWAQRDADKQLIAAMLREVGARIEAFGQTDFYRDGLPPALSQVQTSVMMHANQLNPPAMPQLSPTPGIDAPLMTPLNPAA